MRTIYTYIRQARSINFECKGTSSYKIILTFTSIYHTTTPPPPFPKKVRTNFIIINFLYVNLRKRGKELYYLKEGCINSICWHIHESLITKLLWWPNIFYNKWFYSLPKYLSFQLYDTSICKWLCIYSHVQANSNNFENVHKCIKIIQRERGTFLSSLFVQGWKDIS